LVILNSPNDMNWILILYDIRVDSGETLLGGLKGRDHGEDLGVGRRITLRWTFGR
jgi:hypothetical protein